jgi:hypothetical protein
MFPWSDFLLILVINLEGRILGKKKGI